MAVANGYGKMVTSGSVFMYDIGDTINSYKGKPTTNFYTNGHFSGGSGIPQEAGSNATNTIIQLANPGNSPYVLQQTMGFFYTEYQINLTNQLQSNTTYVLSGWYAESADYVGESRMFHCRAFSNSGAHVALGVGIGTVLRTVEVGGLIWKYCYATITTPADYSNDFNWYVGYGGGNYTGARYYTNLMMEVGSTPSQFVDGTRSVTQGLLPLVGSSTINLSNVSFDSNAQMTFDGTNDRFNTNVGNLGNNATYEAIIYCKGNVSTFNMFMGQFLPYIGVYNGNSIIYSDSINSTQRFPITAGGTISYNKYHHVVCTREYDGSNTTMKIYIDNVLQSQTNWSGAATYNNDTVNIGDGQSSTWYPFYGDIPIARIYNRTLSSTEVRQNYNKYKTRFNLA